MPEEGKEDVVDTTQYEGVEKQQPWSTSDMVRKTWATVSALCFAMLLTKRDHLLNVVTRIVVVFV